MSRDTALAAWTLTFGEDNTIQWCLYQGETLWGRFITKEDALHYLDEISKGAIHTITDQELQELLDRYTGVEVYE